MRDGYLRFVNPAAERQVVPLIRVAIVLLAILGVAVGRILPSLLTMTLWTYTMYVAGVTPALVAALVWPRATRDAALYSMAAGISVTLLWELVAATRGSVAEPAYVFGVPTIFPALLASVGTLTVVTVRRRR
jgi:Na+/proline symporter